MKGVPAAERRTTAGARRHRSGADLACERDKKEEQVFMIRAIFVFATVALAVALAVGAAATESRLLVRALIVGFGPAVWGAWHLVEWITGRELWRFQAPYPYRWMREGDTAMSPPANGETADRSESGAPPQSGDRPGRPVAA
jgi:hypothetical protein